METEPTKNSKGEIVADGAVAGFDLWDGEVAILLRLTLDPTHNSRLIIGSVSLRSDRTEEKASDKGESDPVASPRSAEPDRGTGAEQAGTPTHTAGAQTVQFLIPVHYALNIGWSLFEAARQAQALDQSGPQRPM